MSKNYINKTPGSYIRAALTSAVMLLGGLASSQAGAVIIVFNDLLVSGGVVSGTAAGASGTGILFDRISSPGLGLTFECDLCTLAFTTGPGAVGVGFASFTGPGSFAITGGVSTIPGGPGTLVPVGTTLLAGTFTGTPLAVFGPGPASFTFLGFGIDTKDPMLLALFGLAPATPFLFASTDIALGTAVIVPGVSFTGTIVNADVSNFAPVQIPEPAALGLMGLGLMLLTSMRRRGRKYS